MAKLDFIMFDIVSYLKKDSILIPNQAGAWLGDGKKITRDQLPSLLFNISVLSKI